MYAKDPYEAKYQYLFNKREKVGLKQFNDPKAFIDKMFIKILKNTIQVKNVKY